MSDLAKLRTAAISVFQAGVAAADPYLAVKGCLQVDGQQISILTEPGQPQKRTGAWSTVHLIAFGKAACAMAKAVQDSIPASLLAPGSVAVTNYENVTVLAGVDVIGAGHPLPDTAGLNAAQRCAQSIGNAKAGELVLVLVSGGGSALIPYPVESVSLADKIATTNLLLASGATINEINCVRKHLSQLKGGGLAKLTFPADLHALILSDVLGDEVSAIASGPTVPDPSTYGEAIAVFQAKGLWDKVPAAVQTHLLQGQSGNIPETPKPGDDAFNHSAYTLIGSNTISLHASLKAAEALGYDTKLYSGNLSGEARQVAAQWVTYAKELIASGISRPTALLAGGETTVTLTGNGLGGRNQEMALAFAIAAQQQGLAGQWTFLSGGTDGRDGPTDAAGGLVDPNTLKRLLDAGLDPDDLLANNDSYSALKQANDLLMTGATGTNVADLQVLLINPILTP
ncbi:MAG: glycerate kinase [Methylococcales bacterium]|nr:glycerate kinase [Methylococcales bacterium]